MTAVWQFCSFNLLPSLLAGFAVLALVVVGLQVARITHGPLRLCLLTAPLIKSTLVLAGLQPVLGWLSVTHEWQALAVPSGSVLPILGGAFGFMLLGHVWLHRGGCRRLTEGAVSAGPAAHRLERALDRVLQRYGRSSLPLARCSFEGWPRPAVLVTERPLNSPMAVLSPAPTVVFPRELADELDEDELEGALAHEVAHIRLRQPMWCSTAGARLLTAVNPFALAMAAHLHLEEEKACDQLAIRALGRRQAYARMLLKAFRHARRHAPLSAAMAQAVRLIGRRPMLTERVEQIMSESESGMSVRGQHVATAFLWCIIVVAFMSA